MIGPVFAEESPGCTVHALDDRPVAIVGVKDLCVVSTKGALFLTDREHCPEMTYALRKEMERNGVEPLTSTMPLLRSTD